MQRKAVSKQSGTGSLTKRVGENQVGPTEIY